MRAIAPASAAPIPAPDLTGPASPYNFATQPSRVQLQQQAAVYNQQPATHPQSQLQPQPRTRTVQSFTANSLRSSHGSNNNSSNINSSGVAQNTSAFANTLSNNISPSLHPQFRAKAVCRLTCKSCLSDVCMRGMKAILLADSRVELYSTDRPPRGVQLVYDDYRTRNCKCRIRDVACLGCGNTLGYHVTQPCESCLEACNNGHFWMFHSDGVSCTERYLPKSYFRPSSSSTVQGMASESTSVFSSDSYSTGSTSSRTENRSRSRRRRTWQRGSEGSSTQSQGEVQDLSFRRRTSIHDIEYNRAVGAGPRANSAVGDSRLDRQGYGVDEGRDDNGGSSSDPGEYDDDDVEDENDDDDDNDNEDNDDTEDEEEEPEEDKPVVMLWAELHAQEERYLQQMQQELMIQQQQQLLMQQRYLERQRQLEAQQLEQQQQDHDQNQEQGQEQHLQDHQRVSVLAPSLPALNPPTVGSRYHSMISAAISNASMMLWDDGRSLSQYDKLCR
ncbi:Protein fam72a [Mortierella alpina]|nr:Protein fam72a [Mortierella alpina]